MPKTIKMNNYEVFLKADIENLEGYQEILKNIETLIGLKPTIATVASYVLPYRHNIDIKSNGEIELYIFEKDHNILKDPEIIVFGKINDFESKKQIF
jgi:hypothetical protein